MCRSEQGLQVLLEERIKQKAAQWIWERQEGMFLAQIKLEMDKVSGEFLHSLASLGEDPIIILRSKETHIPDMCSFNVCSPCEELQLHV